MLKQMGCHEVINYKDKDWKKEFRNKVKGVDVYFDNGERIFLRKGGGGGGFIGF